MTAEGAKPAERKVGIYLEEIKFVSQNKGGKETSKKTPPTNQIQ